MNKHLSGWQVFILFLVFFVLFAVTRSANLGTISSAIGTIADILLLVSAVVGVRNYQKSHKKDVERH